MVVLRHCGLGVLPITGMGGRPLGLGVLPITGMGGRPLGLGVLPITGMGGRPLGLGVLPITGMGRCPFLFRVLPITSKRVRPGRCPLFFRVLPVLVTGRLPFASRARFLWTLRILRSLSNPAQVRQLLYESTCSNTCNRLGINRSSSSLRK